LKLWSWLLEKLQGRMIAGLDVLQGSRGMAVTISWFLLLVLAGLASNLLVCEIHAKEYNVGGELEWTFPPAAQSTWYSDVWARPINFKVGDVLGVLHSRPPLIINVDHHLPMTSSHVLL
jgi:hypothetical protein